LKWRSDPTIQFCRNPPGVRPDRSRCGLRRFKEDRDLRIKPIKTEADYEVALKEVERLFDANPGTTEADRLEVLTTLIEAYEGKHYAIPLPDPIEAILYHLESRGPLEGIETGDDGKKP
jgi:hypothetical protein